jgi:hypothetical protein
MAGYARAVDLPETGKSFAAIPRLSVHPLTQKFFAFP